MSASCKNCGAAKVVAKVCWRCGVSHLRTNETRTPSPADAETPEHLHWKGEGPPPASWWVGNTKVYRSYEDYCDD